MKPWSRGTVRLTSPDPRAPLAIDHGFLTDERDVAVLVDGVGGAARAGGVRGGPRRTRRARCAPGPSVDAERHVREAARGFFHPVGTCAIGSVVDGDGRVHGCEGLSVADASVMPSIPRANTNLSTIALAERLAERMLARQLTSRSSGHTTRSTRAKAPRWRRSGVSRRGVADGLVGDAELRRRRAGEGELAVVGVAGRGVSEPRDVDAALASRLEDRLLHGGVASSATGERSSKRVPRPTSSRERARRTSSSRWVRLSLRTSALAPRWSGCLV